MYVRIFFTAIENKYEVILATDLTNVYSNNEINELKYI